MTTPEHITRIIERLDPVDREALEQHLKDKSIMGDLMCMQEIRQAIGDPHGKLMQDEVVSAVNALVKERDEHLDHLKQICEIVGEVENGKHDIGAAWESVAAIKHQRDELAARAARLLSVSGLDSDWPEVAKIINETPAISLSEVRAQAIADFIDREVPRIDPEKPERLCPKKHHCEHALFKERERIHKAAAKEVK